MARKLTTPDRVMLLMALVPYLLEHGPTPLEELSSAFDVEVPTLRRLVQFLGVAGVPGETRTYQHEDLFDIDWDALEQHDIVNLTRVVAVDDTPRFSNAETAALLAGLHALEPMLPEKQRRATRSISAKLSSTVPVDTKAGPIGDSGWPVSVDIDPVHAVASSIAEAMESRRRLSFGYSDAMGRLTSREVEPLLLGQSGGGWYLRAFCLDRRAERTFLIDRMRDLRILEAASEREPLLAASPPGIEHGELTATLSISRSALQRIADFAPRVIEEPSPGHLRIEVELLHPAIAVRMIQAASGEAVVEAPAAAREAVNSWADRALAQYGE